MEFIKERAAQQGLKESNRVSDHDMTGGGQATGFNPAALKEIPETFSPWELTNS